VGLCERGRASGATSPSLPDPPGLSRSERSLFGFTLKLAATSTDGLLSGALNPVPLKRRLPAAPTASTSNVEDALPPVPPAPAGD
jgi:hypothetical protein